MRLLYIFFVILAFSCSERNIYDEFVIDLEGNKVKIREISDEKLVIYLWTGTCLGHTKDLKRLSELYQSRKITRKVISIAIMMDQEDVLELKKKNSLSDEIPFYADPEGKLGEVIKITFLPSTIFIDERGKVTGNYPGLAEKLLTSVAPHN